MLFGSITPHNNHIGIDTPQQELKELAPRQQTTANENTLFEQFETDRQLGESVQESEFLKGHRKESSINHINSNVISELLMPIRQESTFFKRRNNSNDTSQLVQEVKRSYPILFEGGKSSASKLESLPEIVVPPTQQFIGVSPEKMHQIIQENKLRRQRYQLRSEEVKLLESQIQEEGRLKKEQRELERYERARKIRQDYLDRQSKAHSYKQQRVESSPREQNYLAEEPLFQKMERIRLKLERREARKLQDELKNGKYKKQVIDLKELRQHAVNYQLELVERKRPETQQFEWRPPTPNKIQKETWQRDLDLKKQQQAKAQLRLLLLEKQQKFSDFIRKYLPVRKQKRLPPKPSQKKLSPRPKIKVSPSLPQLQSHSTPISQKLPAVHQKQHQTKKHSCSTAEKEADSNAESRKPIKQIQPGEWTIQIESNKFSPERKFELVQHAAKILEQKALRTEAKLTNNQSTLKSNRSQNCSFSRSPRMYKNSSVKVLPLPHTTSYYEQLNSQINDIQMTDALLVDAIKAKMAMLTLKLGN